MLFVNKYNRHGHENKGRKTVVMMGGLHIETNLLKLIGDWLHGSGWITLLVQANVTTSGKAESTLSSSHVTRTRYTHQITVRQS